MSSLSSSAPAAVAVTGTSRFLGAELARRLAARGVRVLALGPRPPGHSESSIEFHRLDLLDADAPGQLAELLRKEGVEALAHTAFRSEPGADLARDRELDVLGSLRVAEACANARVGRLVVASTTMVYGARPDNPNFLDESHPRRARPEVHAVADRIEMEEELERLGRERPSLELCVLRSAWVLGPRSASPVARYFSLPMVPVPLGYDPLLQLLHEDDQVRAFESAVTESRPGLFNLVAPGVLPVSRLLRLAGRRSLRLPGPLLDRLAVLPSRSVTGDPPSAFFDYLRYPWVADGARGWEAFGEPAYTTRETWMAFVSARRMRRYR